MALPADQAHRFPLPAAVLAYAGTVGWVGALASVLSRGAVTYLSADVSVDADAGALLDASAASPCRCSPGCASGTDLD